LLSEEGIPKLVDFGFAERYELKGPHAFESQLAYGTPEYLCPERAKGIVHDTRKSDVWSLAITFFEILTGRTPFEREGEKFTTKEELETYWKRTVSGRWLDMKRERSNGRVGPALEALLKRMLAPNARNRLTAAEACKDSYWTIQQRMCILPVIFYTLIINTQISRPGFARRGAFQATVLYILGTLEQIGCHRKVQNTLADTPWRRQESHSNCYAHEGNQSSQWCASGPRRSTITHISRSEYGFEPVLGGTTERRVTRATDRKGEYTPQRIQAAKPWQDEPQASR